METQTTQDQSKKEKIRAFARQLIESIASGKIATHRRLDYEKRKLSKQHRLKNIPKNSEILAHATILEKDNIRILVKKPVRTISGVANVAVMAKPSNCPGKCIYCPEGENSPKSYTGLEPATRRGKMFNYDPWKQTENRIAQLKAIGHSTDKIELIIMGGTFMAQPKKYQRWFVKRCLDALNAKESKTLDRAKKLNESAKTRCVGLTIETRPDYCTQSHIDSMLDLGATRVELGVQTLSDAIYKKVSRGHTVKDVKTATKALKDSAMKIVYHMMPCLFQDEKEDQLMFRKLFKDPSFQPDMLKIYPALVIEGTGLCSMYRNKKYTPLTNKKAAVLLARVMQEIPRYVRIMRCQRDIPKEKIIAGPTAGNLREIAEQYLEKNKKTCNCIRCHEAGHLYYKKGILPEKVTTGIEKYDASGGKEYFIASEDKSQKIILGYLRLRIPSKSTNRQEIDSNTALIRELKVFGTALPLREKNSASFQHHGIGKKLMHESEKIAKKESRKKIIVISAVGTKEYYRTLGYTDDGPYMSKTL